MTLRLPARWPWGTSLNLTLTNADSRGGVPLKIHVVANAKINGSDLQLGNATERFLDVRRTCCVSGIGLEVHSLPESCAAGASSPRHHAAGAGAGH